MALAPFAEIHVRDLQAVRAWYVQLHGESSFVAHDTEEVWELAENRSIAVEEQPENAGHGAVTVFVDDLDTEETAVRAVACTEPRPATFGSAATAGNRGHEAPSLFRADIGRLCVSSSGSSSSANDAELVALWIGEHRPRLVASLTDVDESCPEGDEAFDLRLTFVGAGVGPRAEIEMHTILDDLVVEARHEADADPATPVSGP